MSTSSPQIRRNNDQITLTLCEGDIHHVREMVRQQLLGDIELMRDVIAGREDPEIRWDLGMRIAYLRGLARELGLPPHPDRRRDSVTEDRYPDRPISPWKRRLAVWLFR